jgi:hypothetical protein
MVGLTRSIFGLVLVLGLAATSAAQAPLNLQIRGGQVTLQAENVALRTILSEWARVGGTNVIGADRVAGPPVSIELTDVPERQALEVLLRNVSGYMLAMRPAGVQGASLFNRILIMPPSVAPRALPQQAATPRFPVNVPPADDEAPPDVVLEGPAGPNRGGPPVRMPTVTGQMPEPLPVPETTEPASPGTPGAVIITPANPFGLPPGSSSQPGVITPVPQPQPPAPPSPD